MNKKLSALIIVICLFISSKGINAETDGLYYSSKMVENATFVWNVTQSEEFYEDIPEGVNLTITLKDNLYPGPISEADLETVYASVKVDGNKYTGEGFPLFWHLYKISDAGATNITIREEFEAETTLFNVSDGPDDFFNVNFTIIENQYTLFVEMDIDPTDGLTKRYYEHFNDNDTIDSTIELNYIDYYIEIPIETSTPSTPKTINGLNILISCISLSFLGVILIRRRIIRK